MTLVPAFISPEIHPQRGMSDFGLWNLLIAWFDSLLSIQMLFV
jgi:hypothetical protein